MVGIRLFQCLTLNEYRTAESDRFGELGNHQRELCILSKAFQTYAEPMSTDKTLDGAGQAIHSKPFSKLSHLISSPIMLELASMHFIKKPCDRA
jgi:hypothetical protein